MTDATATVSIHVRFPAGRYHATAWGHHVNEGELDWPPSPWRVLRALVATWHNRARGEIPRERLASLVRKLSGPPAYHLPRCFVPGHTRHYMRDHQGKAGLVLDGFVAVPHRGGEDDAETLVIQWAGVMLGDSDREALRLLLERLTYLGRAESWCDAALGPAMACNVRPGEPQPSGTVRPLELLALEPEAGLEELEQDTAGVRRAGATRPQGTRWLRYWVPDSQPAMASRAAPKLERPTLALFHLTSPSRKRLPALTDAFDLAGTLRDALLARSEGWHSDQLTGKDERGRPLQSGHRHAHYFPVDRSGQGLLDSCWIYAPTGLEPAACAAIGRLRALEVRRTAREGAVERSRDPEQLAQVVLLGIGAPRRFPGEGQRVEPLLGPSKAWCSLTPFFPSRFLPGALTAEVLTTEIRRELGRRPEERLAVLAPSAMVSLRAEPAPYRAGGHEGRRPPRWSEYRRWRTARSGRTYQPPCPSGAWLRIEFAEPVEGPLALGFGAHFGLGLFVCEDES